MGRIGEMNNFICRYFFVERNCKYGVKCPFPHISELKRIPEKICRFYLKGECLFKNFCWYDHVRIMSNGKLIKFLQKSNPGNNNFNMNTNGEASNASTSRIDIMPTGSVETNLIANTGASLGEKNFDHNHIYFLDENCYAYNGNAQAPFVAPEFTTGEQAIFRNGHENPSSIQFGSQEGSYSSYNESEQQNLFAAAAASTGVQDSFFQREQTFDYIPFDSPKGNYYDENAWQRSLRAPCSSTGEQHIPDISSGYAAHAAKKRYLYQCSPASYSFPENSAEDISFNPSLNEPAFNSLSADYGASSKLFSHYQESCMNQIQDHRQVPNKDINHRNPSLTLELVNSMINRMLVADEEQISQYIPSSSTESKFFPKKKGKKSSGVNKKKADAFPSMKDAPIDNNPAVGRPVSTACSKQVNAERVNVNSSHFNWKEHFAPQHFSGVSSQNGETANSNSFFSNSLGDNKLANTPVSSAVPQKSNNSPNAANEFNYMLIVLNALYQSLVCNSELNAIIKNCILNLMSTLRNEHKRAAFPNGYGFGTRFSYEIFYTSLILYALYQTLACNSQTMPLNTIIQNFICNFMLMLHHVTNPDLGSNLATQPIAYTYPESVVFNQGNMPLANSVLPHPRSQTSYIAAPPIFYPQNPEFNSQNMMFFNSVHPLHVANQWSHLATPAVPPIYEHAFSILNAAHPLHAGNQRFNLAALGVSPMHWPNIPHSNSVHPSRIANQESYLETQSTPQVYQQNVPIANVTPYSENSNQDGRVIMQLLHNQASKNIFHSQNGKP